MKERRPVDVVGQFPDGLVLDDPGAHKFGNWGRIGFPVAFKTVCPCLRQGYGWFAFASAEGEAVLLLFFLVFLSEFVAIVGTQQSSGNRY